MTINNNNIFGAFTLGEVRSGQLTGNWLNKEYIANYGWFGGGLTSIPLNPITPSGTVDRIDFSNDSVTASSRTNLNISATAATGNSNYGWFGASPALTASSIDRIDFSNDSGTPSLRGKLSSARAAAAEVQQISSEAFMHQFGKALSPLNNSFCMCGF